MANAVEEMDTLSSRSESFEGHHDWGVSFSGTKKSIFPESKNHTKKNQTQQHEKNQKWQMTKEIESFLPAAVLLVKNIEWKIETIVSWKKQEWIRPWCKSRMASWKSKNEKRINWKPHKKMVLWHSANTHTSSFSAKKVWKEDADEKTDHLFCLKFSNDSLHLPLACCIIIQSKRMKQIRKLNAMSLNEQNKHFLQMHLKSCVSIWKEDGTVKECVSLMGDWLIFHLKLSWHDLPLWLALLQFLASKDWEMLFGCVKLIVVRRYVSFQCGDAPWGIEFWLLIHWHFAFSHQHHVRSPCNHQIVLICCQGI